MQPPTTCRAPPPPPWPPRGLGGAAWACASGGAPRRGGPHRGPSPRKCAWGCGACTARCCSASSRCCGPCCWTCSRPRRRRRWAAAAAPTGRTGSSGWCAPRNDQCAAAWRATKTWVRWRVQATHGDTSPARPPTCCAQLAELLATSSSSPAPPSPRHHADAHANGSAAPTHHQLADPLINSLRPVLLEHVLSSRLAPAHVHTPRHRPPPAPTLHRLLQDVVGVVSHVTSRSGLWNSISQQVGRRSAGAAVGGDAARARMWSPTWRRLPSVCVAGGVAAARVAALGADHAAVQLRRARASGLGGRVPHRPAGEGGCATQRAVPEGGASWPVCAL